MTPNEDIKAGYPIHAGDVDSGKNTNAGRGIAPANHDGKNKYCLSTGDNIPTGRNANTAVLAIAEVNIPSVVGLITMKDAFEGVTGTVCSC